MCATKAEKLISNSIRQDFMADTPAIYPTHGCAPMPSAADTNSLTAAAKCARLISMISMAPTLVEEAKVIKMASFLRLHNYADCIPDPYYDGAEGFENVLDLLEDACLGLYDAIKISNS